MESLIDLALALGIVATSFAIAWGVGRAAPRHYDRDEARRQMREERRRPPKEQR